MVKNDILVAFGIINVIIMMVGFHVSSHFLDADMVLRFRIVAVAVIIPIFSLLMYMFYLAAAINEFFATERILILNMTRKC